MDTDGRVIVVEQSGFLVGPGLTPGKHPGARSVLYDSVSIRTTNPPFSGRLGVAPLTIADISGDGRTLTTTGAFTLFSWSDRYSGFSESFPSVNQFRDVAEMSVSADGRYMALVTGKPLLPADTNSREDIYVFDRDAGDGDGLPDAWETTFGLNPASADANSDPWETYILIANTSATDGSATVTLVGESGDPISQTISLPANSRVNVPFSSFFLTPPSILATRYGAIVESSGVEIVVERAMYQTVNGVLWSIGTASLASKLQ